MTDATVSRLGQIEQAGDARALFLQKFAGEVLTAYEKTTVMRDKTRTQTIQSGN